VVVGKPLWSLKVAARYPFRSTSSCSAITQAERGSDWSAYPWRKRRRWPINRVSALYLSKLASHFYYSKNTAPAISYWPDPDLKQLPDCTLIPMHRHMARFRRRNRKTAAVPTHWPPFHTK
jgi:hypothetical protein